jgi:transcriptional regulator with XRE-family HTH domain
MVTNKTQKVDKPEYQAFARRLHTAMNAKGMGNSDLARAVWGEVDDNKGYKVAKNRHQVAVYLKGEGMPERATLQKIAEVLGTTADELAPETQTAAIDRARPEMAMTMLAGQPGMAHLQINATLPLNVAVEIIRIFQTAKEKQAL